MYPDPWEKVLDDRRVREYAANHPTAGRVRVGRAIDLPVAIDRGWLDPDPESETAAALVVLLAHVLAGGASPSGTTSRP